MFELNLDEKYKNSCCDPSAIITDEISTFVKSPIIFLKLKSPTFIVRLINNKIVVKIAEMLVANANPPMPKNFESIIFKIIFKTNPIAAFNIGVLVSALNRRP